MRDHGGDIDKAADLYGGKDWIDLSTGINRRPWQPGPISAHAFQALPTAADMARLCAAAAKLYRCPATDVLALAGASAAIQLLPQVLKGQLAGRDARVLSPTYNEHRASLAAAGWQVSTPQHSEDLAGADLAVIVNPNNPDGRTWTPQQIAQIAQGVGHLIVDESFGDPRPDLSVTPARPENVTVLRSFGKFWGLAGLRLGLAVGAPALLEQVAGLAGPWSVNGPALEIGTAALSDPHWIRDTTIWLAEASLHLDQIVTAHGFALLGGTHLFRLYQVESAQATQQQLARAGIWSRVFPAHPQWIRLGIPANTDEFQRLKAALAV